MKRKARISGTIAFTNEKNQRLEIPRGLCEIEELDGEPAARIYFKDKDGTDRVQDLTEREWAVHKTSKDFVLLD